MSQPQLSMKYQRHLSLRDSCQRTSKTCTIYKTGNFGSPIVRIRVDITVDGPLAATKTDVNRALAAAYESMAVQWHSKFRKRHFTPYGASVYHYQQRSFKYNRSKQKHLGHTLPLVFSGTSRDLSESKRINATRNQATLTMPVRAFNYVPKTKSGRTPIDMVREFTTITDDETRAMELPAATAFERTIARASRKGSKIS